MSRTFQNYVAIFGFLLLLLSLSACGPSAQEIDAKIATAVAAIPTPMLTPTPQPTPTPMTIPAPLPTPTPMPTPTPQPTSTLVPTPTPQPRPTPQPTPTPVVIPTPLPTATPMPTPTPQLIPTPLPTATPMPRPTPQPTPTPISLPALVAISSDVSAQGIASVSGDITVQIDPGRPLASRDISFTIQGLEAWQKFTVKFTDPLGTPTEWVTEDETPYASIAGKPVVEETLYADGSGRADWIRIGTMDVEGIWTVLLKVDDSEYRITYPVTQLQLDSAASHRLGLDFRLYEGSVTDSYFSAFVPPAVALDLQPHLLAVVEKLRDRLDVQSYQIPDLYLLGNQSLLETAAKVAGKELIGWEAGFHKVSEPFPGIYMETASYRTGLRQILTHEYVHLLLDEAAPSAALPAWVNEGTATYYELTLGLDFQRPDIPRRDIFWRAEAVKKAALDNTLIPLRQLESQKEWNEQRDKERVSYQYSEAYMSVRYLIEQFGERSLIDLVGRLNAGASLSDALQVATGISYQRFETDFTAWAKAWQDSEREAVRAYYKEASNIMDGWESIRQQRAQEMQANANAPLSSQVGAKEPLLAAAQALQSRGHQLVSPSALSDFDSQLNMFLDRLVQWLQLELDYVRSWDYSKQVQANNMIPEINARQNMIYAELSDLSYDYQLK